MNPITLYEHQNIAISILVDMETKGRGGFLCDEMGLGKTITMAAYMFQYKIHRHPDLIVCPLSLLTHWENEIKKVYYTFSTYVPRILVYHGKYRKNYLFSDHYDFIITTYAILSKDELAQGFRWGRVVLDESHTIRNPKTKVAASARKVGSHSMFNWCITGTPFNNRMKDIISQCEFIGTYPYNNKDWWKRKTGGQNPEEVKKWSEQYVLRRTKDHLLLPPVYHDIEVEPYKLEVDLFQFLQEHTEEKWYEWKMATGIDKIELQAYILALITKLRLYSDSYYCGSDPPPDQPYKSNSKVHKIVKKVKKVIPICPGNSIIIFSQFVSFLDILELSLKNQIKGIEVHRFQGSMSKEDRDIAVHNFKVGKKPRVLLVSLLAGGCGLNLSFSSTLFLCEPYFNPFIEKQAEERVHRIGQLHQVHIFRFHMNSPIEKWLHGLKAKKLEIASGIGLATRSKDCKTFSMDDLRDLFSQVVKHVKKEKKEKKDKKSKEKPTKLKKEVKEEGS